jgi:hypothetical protein
MKQAITLLCILFSLCAHAQFNKGNKFIGGNITLWGQRWDGLDYNNNRKENYFGLSPSAGVFLNKNFALGTSLGYSHSADRYASQGPVYNHQISQAFTSAIFAKRSFI